MSMLTMALLQQDAHVGEGCNPALGIAEAGSLPAKQQGLRPRKGFAPNSAQKRSYRRAVRRVQEHGFTWYKGQFFTSSQIDQAHFPSHSKPTYQLPSHSNIPNVKGQRYSCFSWNVGGLALDTWDMFQRWIELQDLDIILLQETHWKHDSQWAQSKYHCIHCGTDSHCGLLTMVAKKLCSFDQVTWHSWVPGRLQQVRLHLPGRALDILNSYQHDNYQPRSLFWNTLSEFVEPNHLDNLGVFVEPNLDIPIVT